MAWPTSAHMSQLHPWLTFLRTASHSLSLSINPLCFSPPKAHCQYGCIKDCLQHENLRGHGLIEAMVSELKMPSISVQIRCHCTWLFPRCLWSQQVSPNKVCPWLALMLIVLVCTLFSIYPYIKRITLRNADERGCELKHEDLYEQKKIQS